jgi:hypothetical protein
LRDRAFVDQSVHRDGDDPLPVLAREHLLLDDAAITILCSRIRR